jgi:hypothetical protein
LDVLALIQYECRNTKRSALILMDVVFTDELAGLREFDDFARMGGIRVDRVTIAGQQMSVRCESQRYWTTQVRVSEDECSGS